MACSPRIGFGIAVVLASLAPRLAHAVCEGAAPDGDVGVTESCDDGNATPGDGCSATCDIEASWSCARAVNYDDLGIYNYPGSTAAWTVVDDDTGVQTQNASNPSIALFGQNAQVGTYIVDVGVQTANDDDTIGLALGFSPGDEADPAADWVLIDWKQALQQGVPAGLRVAHVEGAPNGGTSILNDHPQRRCPGTGPVAGCMTQLALGQRFGTTGWTDFATYRMRAEYRPTSLRLWIDDVLELDLEPGDFPGEFVGNVFPNGQFGFYQLSQDQASYTNLPPQGASVCNLTDLLPTVREVAVGSPPQVINLAPLLDDLDDDLEGVSVTVLGVVGAATAVGPSGGAASGTIRVTPTNPAIPGTYYVTVLACDDDAVIPDCDVATITVHYSADLDGDGVLDRADIDDDDDGIPDALENDLGVDPDADADGDGIPNVRDASNRGDGTAAGCTDANTDGVCDAIIAAFDQDRDGRANHRDLDADGDGLLDVAEVGPALDGNGNGRADCAGGVGTNGLCDALETTAGSGVVDYDADAAGPDMAVDTDADGLRDFLDLDSDGDGLWDRIESGRACTDTTPRDGRCEGADPDNDGVPAGIDGAAGFGVTGSPAGVDTDGDGARDFRDLDADGDTLLDLIEGNAGCADAIAPDGVCDGVDANDDGVADDAAPLPPDTDGDTRFDFRDLDADNDGILDGADGLGDPDGDGIRNFRDLDSDDDGIGDLVEGSSGCADTTPRNGRCDGPDANADGLADDATNPTPPDTDGDGARDFVDLDTDNDGAPDTIEGGSGCADVAPADAVCDGPDANGDGRVDDASTNPPRNTDSDPTPDFRDLDSDNDGALDTVEVGSGCVDFDANGVCDRPDSDGDGIVDSIDDLDGFGDAPPVTPTNTDGADLPDYRDPDRDNDGTPDVDASGCGNTAPDDAECDGGDSDGDGAVDPIDEYDGHGVGHDTDGDGVTDSADLDDDNDGIPDAIEAGQDTDGDGVDDELDLDSDDDGLPDVFQAGHGGADADGDGTLDCGGGFGTNGLCDAVETAGDSGELDYDVADTDGDGVDDFRDLDSDDDGISDLAENGTDCADAPANGVCDGGDADGDGVRDSADGTLGFGAGGYDAPPDTDGDDTPDYQDLDSDGDSIFDLDEGGHGDLDADDDGQIDGDDDDGDGIRDPVDDSDLDGTPDADDPDAGSFGGAGAGLDTDGDGTPDARDDDSDDDGLPDADEAGDSPEDPVDTDGDGTPDFQDTDSDDDGVTDDDDGCRLIEDPDQADADGDGLGDACDADANGDGFDDDLGLSGGGCQAGGGTGTGAGLAILVLAVVLRRRRRAVGVVAVAAVAVLALGTAPARAQSVDTSYPVERFRWTGDRDGVLDVEWADVDGHLTYDFGIWVGYANDPLNVYQDGADGRERVASFVADRVGADLVASVDFKERVQIGVEIPLIVSQGADDGTVMAPELSGFSLGDVRLVPKVTLIKQGRAPVSVAVLAGIALPTATSDGYAGDAGATFAPALAISRAQGALRFAANLGYLWRGERTMALDLVVDDELEARVGFGYVIAGNRPVLLDASAAVSTAANDVLGAFNRNYAELKAGVGVDATSQARLSLIAGLGVAEGFGTPDWRVLAGVRFGSDDEPAPTVIPSDRDGDGIVDPDDRCPTEPETVNEVDDLDGCPEALDRDDDGILDDDDTCPDEPEDADGFEDTDGCVDPDNDGDGVLDADDACRDVVGVIEMQGCPDPDGDGDGLVDRLDVCPEVAGILEFAGCPDRDGDGVEDRYDSCPDVAGVAKHAGCKKPQKVTITDSKLEIIDIVYFKLDKDVIEKRSYELLEEVARVLVDHLHIDKIRVEGHTDDQGNDAYNKDLSQRRAEAVVAFLVEHGVAPERLEAMGFGEEVPILSNKNKKGRAANRRVEFKILGGEGVEVEATGPGDDTLE